MKSRFLVRGLLLAGLTSLRAFAVQEGHGGIDIRHDDGTSEPIEAYVENRTSRVVHACELVDLTPELGDGKPWRTSLNNVIAAFHAKLPKGAATLKSDLDKAKFYLLDLPKGDEIVFTNDDASIIGGKKFNGAVRIKNDVYIVKSVWEGYWARRQNDRDLSSQLTRVVHEAALGSYHAPAKDSLGRVVIEILRLAQVFKDKGGEQEFSRLSGRQVAQFLYANHYKPSPYNENLGQYATFLSYVKTDKKTFSSLADARRFVATLRPRNQAVSFFIYEARYHDENYVFNADEARKHVRPAALEKYPTGDLVFESSYSPSKNVYEVSYSEILDPIATYLKEVEEAPTLCK